MKAIPVDVPDAFGPGGRGPELRRWLHDSDLLFPDSHHGFAPPDGSMRGAQVDDGWVVFHGLQVIQIVPDEVHAYCHLALQSDPESLANVWLVDDSSWLSTFRPRHLSDQNNYIIQFYDDVVEVLCHQLVFGCGTFDLERAIVAHSQLCYAYFRRAESMRNQGRSQEARADYKRYLATATDPSSIAYARRCLE